MVEDKTDGIKCQPATRHNDNYLARQLYCEILCQNSLRPLEIFQSKSILTGSEVGVIDQCWLRRMRR